MNFTEAVKTAMAAQNLRAADIARRTGLSDQYVGDLLRGERRWHEAVINKFCEALGFKIEVSTKENE